MGGEGGRRGGRSIRDLRVYLNTYEDALFISKINEIGAIVLLVIMKSRKRFVMIFSFFLLNLHHAFFIEFFISKRRDYST